MTLLVVLAAWIGLGCLTAGVFAAIVRGGGGTSLPAAQQRPEVSLPTPRDRSDEVVRPTANA